MISRGLIAQALEGYDPAEHEASAERARTQRSELLERFPKSGWPEMTLHQYALGQPDHPGCFCWWMEFRAVDLGSIKGGSARKHHIYLQAERQEWWFEEDRYSSVEEAWEAVRSGFVESISHAEAGDWSAVDEIPAMRGGLALLTKTMHLYFPEQVLPICSHTHLTHYLNVLTDRGRSFDNVGTVTLNRMLLADLQESEELRGWSTKELERLLYASEFSPSAEEPDSEKIPDVAVFVQETLEEYGEAGLQARRDAEDRARTLLDQKAGVMTEQDLRALLGLFNEDSHKGKRYQSRFSPAFVGATANGLAQNLDPVNEWTRRLWQGGEDAISEGMARLLEDRKLLPHAGTSYPTMLLHLRAPESFAVWLRPTDLGLQRLRPDYRPARSPGRGTFSDYFDFCRTAVDFMGAHEIPPELLDAVLAAAARAEVEEVGDAENEVGIWVFQANPRVFDIDRAVSEETEMSWVVRQYRDEVRKGDRVYLWRSGTEAGVIAVATVLDDPAPAPGIAGSPYLLEPEALSKEEPRVNLRIDQVLPLPLVRSDLLEDPVLKDLEVIRFANATNFKVTSDQDAALRELIGGTALSVPTLQPELAKGLHLPASFLQEAREMLLERGQAIFYGPPGTGKTRVALDLAAELTREGGRAELVQFHPSYAYEDFVGGFRPREQEEGGIGYERRDGPLRRIAKEAAADPEHPFVLVVDEINRGNIARIFGELLFLLEYRRREVTLQYWPDEPFSLPENLFLIGTMNTADRSIALIDAALRRRFYFLEFSPTAPPVKEVLGGWLREHGLDDEPARLLEQLNAAIELDEFAIGPSYFMNRDGAAPDLERIWRREIMPLLREQLYGSGWDESRFSLKALRARLAESSSEPEVPGA